MWGSPVDGYWFQKHQPSRSTTVTRKWPTTESWRSPPNRQKRARSASHKARLLWQQKRAQEFSFIPTHFGISCCRPLCIAPATGLCAPQVGSIHASTMHTYSESLLVGEKAHPLIFAREGKSCFPKAEHHWNWNVRRTKAVLRQDFLWGYLVIFGRRAIFFFVWQLVEKNEKWHHFSAHADWWSPWRPKNVEKRHLAPSNLTFFLIAIDTNGFRRMKEEGQIYNQRF